MQSPVGHGETDQVKNPQVENQSTEEGVDQGLASLSGAISKKVSENQKRVGGKDQGQVWIASDFDSQHSEIEDRFYN